MARDGGRDARAGGDLTGIAADGAGTKRALAAGRAMPASVGPASGLREPRFKRAFDATLAAIGLVLTLPVWLVLSLCIWLEDGRPIFFGQTRLGRNGRPFRALKFRSMIKDPRSVERQAARDDPRITRVGRVMRRTALDEMPQIWNILRGDMSFVGPRSQPEKEVVSRNGAPAEMFIRDVPGYATRQLVRPGLTGVTQIFAPRDIPHRSKFRYDVIYVRRVRRCSADGLVGDLQMLCYDAGLILRSIWTTVRAGWEV